MARTKTKNIYSLPHEREYVEKLSLPRLPLIRENRSIRTVQHPNLSSKSKKKKKKSNNQTDFPN